MRSLRMTVSGWMATLVTGLLLVAAAQPAMAGWTQWSENFNALTPSTGNADHSIAQAGDYIGVDSDVPYGPGTGLVNGWRAAVVGNHFHVVNNDPRTGLASYGLGNNYDGCAGPGCGAAHPTTVDADTDTVIASVLVREGFKPGASPHSSGPASFYLGDSSLLAAVGGPVNAYRVDIDMDCDNYGNFPQDNNGDLVTLIGDAPASVPYAAPDVTEWYMIRITVTGVGTPSETATVEIADVNDSTGAPGVFTPVGILPSSGGAFALTHILAWTRNDMGCYESGQAAKLWDNFLVEALDDPPKLEIETVPVTNMGNGPNTDGHGSVSYPYNIGKYEVTAGQYCKFLNAVAKTDTYELYNGLMTNDLYTFAKGCKITRHGESGSYTYDFSGRPSGTASDWANRPVNLVGAWDARRFCNWLHNGQPTGPQDATTTEDGAYFMNGYSGVGGGRNGTDGRDIVRKPGAKWFLPTEEEWYKAAWHKNDGVTANYWTYATRSDTVPGRDVTEATNPGNNANYYGGTVGYPWTDGNYTIGDPYYRNTAGEFELSKSAYGTFDQAGNLLEITEYMQPIGGGWTYHLMRGAGFLQLSDTLLPSYRPIWDGYSGADEGLQSGFRVATQFIPPLGTVVIIE